MVRLKHRLHHEMVLVFDQSAVQWLCPCNRCCLISSPLITAGTFCVLSFPDGVLSLEGNSARTLIDLPDRSVILTVLENHKQEPGKKGLLTVSCKDILSGETLTSAYIAAARLRFVYRFILN
ncbi:hypothetical protein CS542_09590 [Pedobacter sp. IW39]|nr:hypothetical protein CS542_09590 [Pedobacter sp. IW39]